jgi:uncharacterized protein with NAD-binding domain and iron-sulfur cluster
MSRQTSVAVFGAGIAGLTAAHELIERGFAVDVFESEPASVNESDCGVGGMARTQWGWAPTAWSLAQAAGDDEWSARRTNRLEDQAEARRALAALVPFAVDSADIGPEAARAIDRVAQELARLGPAWAYRIHVRGYTHTNEPPLPVDGEPPPGTIRWDDRRARAVRDALVAALRGAGVTPGTLQTVALGLGHPSDWRKSTAERCHVAFFVVEDILPGEHGFRFFPAFYRHLRETMRRTPVAAPGPGFVATRRSVHDNLVPTAIERFSPAGGPPFEMPRRRLKSVQELFDLVVRVFEATGYTRQDVERLKVKIFEYLTTCPERRAKELEAVSWWDFIGGDRFSPRMQAHLQAMPQLLVAMSARESDARTFGDVVVQLLKDQVLFDPRTDALLNGPTNEAWFAHWRRYLEHQGVRFRRGTLTGFHVWNGELWPKASVLVRREDGTEEWRNRIVIRDYTVVAVPPQTIQAIVRADDRLDRGDFERIRRFDLGDTDQASPTGALRHMTGIQYFLPAEFKMVEGHSVYPDAPWRLSSVFQSQFWQQRRGWWDGYRGILSVVLCEWSTPGLHGVPAWHLAAEEVARQVWGQIVATVPAADRVRVPRPLLFHFDANMEKRPNGWHNTSPLLINRPGEFEKRPGALGALGYDTHRGWKVVFAGTLMQTHTRMTTMESANESGRHAVNAILEREGFQGDRCTIEPMEEHEFDELKYFIDLDRELLAQGLPHWLAILGLDELPDFVLQFDAGTRAMDAVLGGIRDVYDRLMRRTGP